VRLRHKRSIGLRSAHVGLSARHQVESSPELTANIFASATERAPKGQLLNTAEKIDNIPTKRALVQTAVKLFRVHGYKQTTIAEIAKSAGFHVQTFYRHFSAKEDVIAENWRIHYEMFQEYFNARGSLTTIAIWRRFVKDNAEAATKDGLQYDSWTSLPVLTAECQMYQDQYRQLLTDGIAQDMDVNSKNDLRPGLIACMLFDGNSMAARKWIGKKTIKKEYVESLLAVIDQTQAFFKELI